MTPEQELLLKFYKAADKVDDEILEFERVVSAEVYTQFSDLLAVIKKYLKEKELLND